MVKGIFTSCESMKAILRKQEVISDNLANVNTTAFKKSDLFVRSYTERLNNDLQQPFMNDEVTIDEVVIDYKPGPMVTTDNPLDAAIEGNCFFTVQTNDNTVRYTKAGAFTIDRDGHLATLNGEKVIGETDAPIKIYGNNVRIMENGEIFVDDRVVNRLKLTEFEEPYYLVKTGSNLYKESEKSVKKDVLSNYQIHSGTLEGSNVNPIETMVRMISGYRNYEADQKAMQSADQTLNKAVNEVGRIR